MHHRHGNLLKIEGCCRRGSGVEFGGNVNVWRIGPDTFGEEIDCFLTYDISISEPPLNRNKPHLRYACLGWAGIGVSSDRWAGGVTGVEGGVLITGRRWTALIIGSTLPGMLLHVWRECICFVFFYCLGAVGFGAVSIVGASVILVRGVSTLCCPICSMSPSTFCSTLCSGGRMYGWHCKSLGGSNHLWVECVSFRQCCSRLSDANLY